VGNGWNQSLNKTIVMELMLCKMNVSASGNARSFGLIPLGNDISIVRWCLLDSRL